MDFCPLAGRGASLTGFRARVPVLMKGIVAD